MSRKKILIGLALAILVALATFWMLKKPANAPNQNTQKQQQTQASTPTPEPAFDKKRYSIDDPTSIWVVVNKKRPLPSGFGPSDLVAIGNGEQMRSPGAKALSELLKDANLAGNPMVVISGYRSYGTQTSLYNSYVRKDGVSGADRYSARPGHSEHQTGLVADVGNPNGTCSLDICFGNTPAGKWLKDNSTKYGLIIRYPDGKESLTGYQYEPWHIRFVGVELAQELAKNNQTMEQFFGLQASPDYN